MSLSQHDRRVLSDIEQYLTEHDARLARMLSSFGRSTPLRTLLPRLRGRCRRIPVITAAFLALAASLLVVGIVVRKAALITAKAMACVLALPKPAPFRRCSLHGRPTNRRQRGRRLRHRPFSVGGAHHQ